MTEGKYITYYEAFEQLIEALNTLHSASEAVPKNDLNYQLCQEIDVEFYKAMLNAKERIIDNNPLIKQLEQRV